jgi:hypothetical protein
MLTTTDAEVVGVSRSSLLRVTNSITVSPWPRVPEYPSLQVAHAFAPWPSLGMAS